MSMMNKCAKFRGDAPSGQKVKAGPAPLGLSCWSFFFTFLHYRIEDVGGILCEKRIKNSKEKFVKWATEVSRLYNVSKHSCTQTGHL